MKRCALQTARVSLFRQQSCLGVLPTQGKLERCRGRLSPGLRPRPIRTLSGPWGGGNVAMTSKPKPMSASRARASAESNTAPAGRDSLARLVQAASPADRRQMPRIVSLDLAVAPHLAGSLVHCRQRVRPLLRVRTDHDHMTVPSFG